MDVNNPDTWGTFNEATRAVIQNSEKYNGIGFVLTDHDPYTFIDLDEAKSPEIDTNHGYIYNLFNSYTEYSPSKRGVHIIVKGAIPKGRRRDCMEMYSSQRYMTMTGHIYRKAPIAERQALLKEVWTSMGGKNSADTAIIDHTVPQTQEDVDIINSAAGAKNGATFVELFNGRWEPLYPSQSQADIALINIITFYTKNIEQIVRIFHTSNLGKRDKAYRQDYLSRMITLAFDNYVAPMDFTDLRAEIDAARNTIELPAEEYITGLPELAVTSDILQKFPLSPLDFPPGLIGKIAEFTYNASPRPAVGSALITGLGIMAGLTGKAYNTIGKGLNLYLLYVAPTGSGKDAIHVGTNMIINAVAKQGCPAIRNFLGPSTFASSQAMARRFGNPSTSSSLCIMGEFGLKMQNFAAKNLSAHERNIKGMMLEFFMLSKHGSVWYGHEYADAGKNIPPIDAPALTIIGESTPETFYEAISEHVIRDGMLPRFLMIEKYETDITINDAAHLAKVSDELAIRLAALTTHCSSNINAGTYTDVPWEPDAFALWKEFDLECTKVLNGDTREATKHLWSRRAFIAQRVAAVVAIGQNEYQPKVTKHDVLWAINIVLLDVLNISQRFSRGELGPAFGDNQQYNTMLHILGEYVARTGNDLAHRYKVDPAMHRDGVIRHNYLSTRARTKAAFLNDPKGAAFSLNNAIRALMDNGEIKEITTTDVQSRYNTTGKAYVITQPRGLVEIYKRKR
jgi:Protein of unknown function (DUF3987)